MMFSLLMTAVWGEVVAERHQSISNCDNAIAPGLMALVVGGWALLFWRRRRLHGTTLVAPAVWAAISLAVIGGAGSLLCCMPDAAEAEWAEPLRFAATMSVFCPTMAVLGAKRPQNRAWQFIVLSLWVVLALPSGEWLLQSAGEAFEIHPARRWFLAILVSIGALNVIATRFWLAGLLLLAGQLSLLSGYLPLGDWPLGSTAAILLGLALCLGAMALVAVPWPGRRPAKLPLDRVWLDFRDMFGAVWALRIAERFNSAGQGTTWRVQLGWRGFFNPAGEPVADLPPEYAAEIEHALRMLLLRFVSAEWIARRLNDP